MWLPKILKPPTNDNTLPKPLLSYGVSVEGIGVECDDPELQNFVPARVSVGKQN